MDLESFVQAYSLKGLEYFDLLQWDLSLPDNRQIDIHVETIQVQFFHQSLHFFCFPVLLLTEVV